MRGYRLLLILLVLALLAAVAAWAVGSDPGYLLIQRGGWTIETTLVFAVLAVLATGLSIALLWWLARWPLHAAARRAQRRAQMQFERGALALAEGRPQRAENLLLGASRRAEYHVPALLAAYRAARQRGESRREGELLARIGAHKGGEVAATVLRAEAELADGRAGAAIELLTPLDQAQRLPPAGAKVLIEALAARGRTRESLVHVSRLRRGHVMSAADYDRFEARILAQALAETSDAINLRSLWSELNRSQRRDPQIARAYVQRAAQVKLGDEAAREIEGLLRKQWSDPLAAAYGSLSAADPGARLKAAEALLKQHPASPGLLLALGRLCCESSLWGKAEDYLKRALAGGAGAAAWEALGDCFAAQSDPERASRAYANALALARGAEPQPLVGRATREDLLAPVAVPEERDRHGVPRLPEGTPLS